MSTPTPCQACFDDNVPLITFNCGHGGYCHTCIIAAFQNISAAQPHVRCPNGNCNGNNTIQPNSVQSILPTDLYRRVQNQQIEWTTPASERFYCPNPTCSQLIHNPPRPTPTNRLRRGLRALATHILLPGNITCAHCGSRACKGCKRLTHHGLCAPPDSEFAETIALSTAAGGRRCYNCKTMVERSMACCHVTCKCGAEFCVLCSRVWQDCLMSCPESRAEVEQRLNEIDFGDWQFPPADA